MANISDECIIGLDTMRMFKMVLDVGKGMVGVNGKVLPGYFEYVGGAEVPLYPVETVRRRGSKRVLDTGAVFSGL